MSEKEERNNTKTLNGEELLKYYNNFDPIQYKYGDYFKYCAEFENWEIGYQRTSRHEYSKNFSFLTKYESGATLSNLVLIYGEEEFAEYIVRVYHLIKEKIIGLYLNIDGMERLFSDKYANFEWEMHLGMNYAAHAMDFYRDHFIHQVKNAYTMDVLLNEFGYKHKVEEILLEESNSKISAFVCKYVEQQIEYGDYFADKFILPENESPYEIKRRYYTENIIKMSSYMSALFHDIGYPMTHNMKENAAILDYVFDTYNLNNYATDFNKIRTLLQNTLLFRVVSGAEIKRRIESDMEHGAISAVIFLLHFYENGAINRLEPYKICAVELAALAIYNHTNKYRYIVGDDNAHDYERNIFFQNPISHLLRISDDMQEWGRIYFEITDKSNIVICNRCHTPLIRRPGDDKNACFRCNCTNPLSKNMMHVFSNKGFQYRRIYRVTTCEDMEISREDDHKCIQFRLKYDLFRLLHIAYISPTYAQYRIKELLACRKLLVMQRTKEDAYLHYYMTANIIALKSQIMGEYFFAGGRGIKTELDAFVESVNSKEMSIQEIGSELEKILNPNRAESFVCGYISECELDDSGWKEELSEYLTYATKIYLKLYIVAYVTQKIHEERLIRGVGTSDIYLKKERQLFDFIDEIKKDAFLQDDDVQYMIDEYIRHSGMIFLCLYEHKVYPDEYFKTFKDEEIYTHVISFCETAKFEPLSVRKEKHGNNRLDAYTDLDLFRYIEQGGV